MLHNFKKQIGIAAASICAVGMIGVAYAASSGQAAGIPQRAAAKTVSATWAMGDKTENCQAVVSDATVLSATVSCSDNLAWNKVQTFGFIDHGSVAFSTYNIEKNVAGFNENAYLEYVVTPSVAFTPQVLELDLINCQFGDARVDIVAVSGDNSQMLAEGLELANSKNSDTTVNFENVHHTYEITDLGTSAEPLIVRVYMYGRNAVTNNKNLGIANVTISGSIESGEGEGEGEGGGEEPNPGGDDDIQVPEGWMTVPGDLDVNNWTLSGLRVENPGPGANIGYAKDNCSGTVQFFCTEKGLYSGHFNFYWYKDKGDVELTVTDIESGRVEASAMYRVDHVHEADILLMGLISTGKKELKLTFHAVDGHGNYIANFYTPTFSKVGDNFAQISEVTVEGADAVSFEGYDWNFNLPADYTAETTTLKVVCENAELAAACGGETLTVGENGTITVPTPAKNNETVVELTITPAEGAYFSKEVYKVRLFHLGNVTVSSLTVDGVAVDAEVITSLNSDEGAATVAGNIYTAVPAVIATFVDGTTATGKATLEGTTATYAFSGQAGDLSKEFTLAVEGVHTYTATSDDQTVSVRFDSANNQADGTWSNGLYTLESANNGWGGTQFKMKPNRVYKWHVPADVVVKQFIFGQLFDNYSAGHVEYVRTGDATVYLPTNRSFQQGSNNAYDLVVNIEGHKAGEPIEFGFDAGSEPVAWFDFVYVRESLTSAPEMRSIETTSTEHLNHAIVNVTFDREMKGAKATVNGVEVEADGGSSVLSFAVWNLPYNETSTFTLAAGAAEDNYGNKTDSDISVDITVGAPAQTVLENIVVVSDVDEWKAALASVNSTNTSADAAPVVIYVLNGDYDFGSEEQTFRCYNVSVVGESREGVLLHGNRTGISNPVVSTRYATNTYMQDLTIRNDYDFPIVSVTHNKDDRKGVSVAHYGGKKDVMKQVTLQAIQDTQVTGENGYYVDCDIHGSTDFICGGGNHFYDRCNLIIEVAGPITAPSTSASLKYGYVFQQCHISGDKGYTLGRPWQNEPRAFFLNTTMEALPADAGWSNMSNLVTHFFEYNSMDAAGNALDLSKRKNSPTSVNSYSPILPEEYAPHFIVENVLGRQDSWLPTEDAVTLDAPSANIAGTEMTWNDVNGAAAYVVYRNGRYVGHTTECSFSLAQTRAASDEDDALYTVRAMNSRGGVGKPSAELSTTALTAPAAAAESENVEFYDMQGVRVADDFRGVCVRVTTASDGTRSVEKVVRK